MTMTDRAALSYMSDYEDLAMGPRIWFYNMSQEYAVSYSTLARRLRILSELDEPMVRKDPDRGDGYQITEFGKKVARGEVSTERIRELDPNAGDTEEDEEGEESDGDQ